jgi:dihydrofolate reductase
MPGWHKNALRVRSTSMQFHRTPGKRRRSSAALYSHKTLNMKVRLFLCVSLDGFIATSDGSSAWPDGAWWDWCSFCTSSNSLVLGRVSYSGLMHHDFFDILSPKCKVVVSSQELSLSDNSWKLVQTPNLAVEYSKAHSVDNIVVGGGRELGLAFLREGLLDEIVLDGQPVLFGTGTHLSGELEKPIGLELLEKENLEHDAIRLRYKVY